MRTICHSLFLILLFLLLAGCGGSGGAVSKGKVGSDEVLTGIFVDSPVENLGYRTVSRNGAIRGGHTDADGRFSFREGDRITFYVGHLQLDNSRKGFGEISGLAFPEIELGMLDFPGLPSRIADSAGSEQERVVLVLSPLDFSENRDFDDVVVGNIARLLQSLDYDGDPSRRRHATKTSEKNKPGIFISDYAHELAVGAFVDLYTNAIELKVGAYVDSAGWDRRYRPEDDVRHYVVPRGQAITHLRESLDRIEIEYFGPELSDIVLPGNPKLEACIKDNALAQGTRYVWDFKALDCSRKGLESLAGIEVLINLESLTAYGNQIQSADVSGLRKLRWLDLGFNRLTTVDLYENPLLEAVFIESNALESIRLPQGEFLETLILSNNQLENIDLSGLPNLRQLSLFNNGLASIELRHNVALKRVFLGNNLLTELDVSAIPGLIELSAGGNRLQDIVLDTLFTPRKVLLDNNPLSESSLRYLLAAGISDLYVDLDADKVNDVVDNCLMVPNTSQRDVNENGTGDACDLLQSLSFRDVNLAACVQTYDPDLYAYELMALSCSGQDIASAEGVQAFVYLEHLDLSLNRIEGLNLAENRALVSVDVSHNQLSVITLDANDQLESVDIQYNPLTAQTIDYLSGLGGIEILY